MLRGELEKLAAAVSLTGVSLDDIGEFAGATFDYHAAHPELARLLQWEGLARRRASVVRAAQRLALAGGAGSDAGSPHAPGRVPAG